MKYSDHLKRATGRLRPPQLLGLGALGLCALLLLAGLSPRWHKPVVETITTVGTRQTNAQPAAVHFTPQLPRRDVDVEAAGDHIAAAAMYLKSRQSAAALRAMTQARAATTHAIDRRRQQGKQFDVLQETLKEIDSAEHSVQRGALGDARVRLISLNGRLDDSLER
ncbi:MAG TPA: hypothetical protein VM934_07095 [Pyrinomonadaceae bacterium]|jgi:hypothetical protein|nr:hypothetical protein [Pyrinomonadaceae bacterium]